MIIITKITAIKLMFKILMKIFMISINSIIMNAKENPNLKQTINLKSLSLRNEQNFENKCKSKYY